MKRLVAVALVVAALALTAAAGYFQAHGSTRPVRTIVRAPLLRALRAHPAGSARPAHTPEHLAPDASHGTKTLLPKLPPWFIRHHLAMTSLRLG